MSFEDTMRVADLKTRPDRLLELLGEPSANALTHSTEYMKPRVEELAGMLPAHVGAWVERSRLANACLQPLTRGMTIRSSGIVGYLALRSLAKLSWLRPRTLRYQQEMRAIDDWLALILQTAGTDPLLATEIAHCQELVTGYGDTRERGLASYRKIVSQLDTLQQRDNAAQVVADLRRSAQQEDSGADLDAALHRHDLPSPVPAT